MWIIGGKILENRQTAFYSRWLGCYDRVKKWHIGADEIPLNTILQRDTSTRRNAAYVVGVRDSDCIGD